MILWNLFGGFLANLIQNAMKELLEAISQIFGDAFYAAFYIEKMEGLSVLTSGAVEAALGNMYTILVYLLALKFLWKGVQVYILWRSGEAENPPTEMVKGAVLAMIVAAAFPLLYSYAVEITRSIGEMVLMPFLEQQEEGSGFNLVLSLIGQAAQTASVAMALGFVVYTVVLVCAYVQMVFRGIELLVYRLGVPLAVVGFIDSDDGVWKGYIQSLFRQLATVLVCYVLTMLGMAVMSSLGWLNLIVGIALEFAAFKAPKMLSQFLIPSGGGGGKMQIVYTAARAFLGG